MENSQAIDGNFRWGKKLYKDKNNFIIKNYLLILDLSDNFSDIQGA